MQLDVAPTAEEAARRAALYVADGLREAIAQRGRASVALSGGASPRMMFAELAQLTLDWSAVQIFQVDERVAPLGDPQRNLNSVETLLVTRGPVARAHLHAMAVENADLAAAAGNYEDELRVHAGFSVTLDVVHLGLGADGHTASLFPGDAGLRVHDRAVTVTAEHSGYRRLSLTLPALDRARRIVWLATGAAKAAVVGRLIEGSWSAPAGQVARDRAIVVTDKAAAGVAAAVDFTPPRLP